MFDLSIQIFNSHAHGRLMSHNKPMNQIMFTGRQVLCADILHTSLGHTYVFVSVLRLFRNFHKLSPQPTVQA